jgi:glycosyltransferase involved in cell wall biosynthesis
VDRLARWFNKPYYRDSLEACDLLILSNEDEYAYARDELRLEEKCRMIPSGLTTKRMGELAEVSQDPRFPAHPREVACIGAWSPRKGARDCEAIIRRVRAALPETRFAFLGMCHPPEQVLDDLRHPPSAGIRVVPSYRLRALPELLRGCCVGAFPSYLEGFPFALLEKLAAGLPTVAYNAPGSRDLLARVDPGLLVPRGDIEAFANRLVQLLRLPAWDLLGQSRACRDAARWFSWPGIADLTVAAYREGLARLATARIPSAVVTTRWNT